MLRKFPFFLLLVVFVSCGKYDEGPGFSLRSKQNRLKGEWTLKNLYHNKIIIPIHPDSYRRMTIEVINNINNTGVDQRLIVNTYDVLTDSFTKRNGKWNFVNKKGNLELSLYGSDGYAIDTIEVWQIIRLTNKELVLEKIGQNPFKTRQEWIKN